MFLLAPLLLAPLSTQADDSAKRLLMDALGTVRKAVPAPPAPAQPATAPGGASAPGEGGMPSAAANPAPAAANAQVAPGCRKLGRLSSIGALGARPESYQPAVLWPANAHCELHEFREALFPEAEAQKREFAKIGKIPCKTCEMGAHFDDWPRNVPEAKIGAMKLGERLQWKGARYSGAVVVTGEHPIRDYACRQYRWTLTQGGAVAAERHGLFCQYKAPYAPAPAWHQMI